MPARKCKPGFFTDLYHYDEDGYEGSTVDTLVGETKELDAGE